MTVTDTTHVSARIKASLAYLYACLKRDAPRIEVTNRIDKTAADERAERARKAVGEFTKGKR